MTSRSPLALIRTILSRYERARHPFHDRIARTSKDGMARRPFQFCDHELERSRTNTAPFFGHGSNRKSYRPDHELNPRQNAADQTQVFTNRRTSAATGRGEVVSLNENRVSHDQNNDRGMQQCPQFQGGKILMRGRGKN
jgi:hypothetical protein